jgi:hypothetical protein
MQHAVNKQQAITGTKMHLYTLFHQLGGAIRSDNR